MPMAITSWARWRLTSPPGPRGTTDTGRRPGRDWHLTPAPTTRSASARVTRSQAGRSGVSSSDSNVHPSEFNGVPDRIETPGDAPDTGEPGPPIEWDTSHDQMLLDAFSREGEAAPIWLTSPIFASSETPEPGPPVLSPDESFEALPPIFAPSERPEPGPPILAPSETLGLVPTTFMRDEPLGPIGPITQPHEDFQLDEPTSSLDQPIPAWLYGSAVERGPEHFTGPPRRIVPSRRSLPWVAAVALVVTVGVASAVVLGGHSGSTQNQRRPVAIAGSTTTTSLATVGSTITATSGTNTDTTAVPPTTPTPTTPTDSAAIASFSSAPAGSPTSGRTTSGVFVPATRPPGTQAPPPATQAPPPATQPPTTPPAPPTTATTLPPTTDTSRPPRTTTTLPPITPPTLPSTSTTRPHR